MWYMKSPPQLLGTCCMRLKRRKHEGKFQQKYKDATKTDMTNILVVFIYMRFTKIYHYQFGFVCVVCIDK